MTRSILIIFAHPAIHRSRANRAMAEAVRDLPGVTFHDLYETYPDLLIDVAHEQRLLSEHDALVVQHPFYWYSAPALVKEWLDLVLTHGWAYGENGAALRGKTWMSAITTGGREHAYTPEGYNRFTIPELMRPFEATAGLCGMPWREPFVLTPAQMETEAALKAAAASYRAHILALQRAP